MKYVAFLRAINVPGHAGIIMSDVRRAFDVAGCCDVSTYIQSGNVIFETPGRSASGAVNRVRDRLRDRLKVEPQILVRSAGEMDALIRGAPFRRGEADTSIKRYVAFLFKKPSRKPTLPLGSSTEALEVVAIGEKEVFVVSRRKKNGFFGFPNNFVEAQLGVPATSRNWSTVTKLAELVRSESKISVS